MKPESFPLGPLSQRPCQKGHTREKAPTNSAECCDLSDLDSANIEWARFNVEEGCVPVGLSRPQNTARRQVPGPLCNTVDPASGQVNGSSSVFSMVDDSRRIDVKAGLNALSRKPQTGHTKLIRVFEIDSKESGDRIHSRGHSANSLSNHLEWRSIVVEVVYIG